MSALVGFRWVIRVAGLLALGLGLSFWSGSAGGLVQVHMLLGLLVAVSVVALAVIAARRGVPVPLVVVAVLLALALPGLGASQMRIMPGASHWVIQVVHLLTGLGAIGIGEALAGGALRRR
ncbi:hypothetical protein [Deinococcus aquiradiocola]|uniref:hypothetical protein n=1 Tax=Deinococcus aquiradiocola TaxID=393059 RepID=UPI00166D302A|nr:hypothetical protein [Deinococcus aquiradiocola]